MGYYDPVTNLFKPSQDEIDTHLLRLAAKSGIPKRFAGEKLSDYPEIEEKIGRYFTTTRNISGLFLGSTDTHMLSKILCAIGLKYLEINPLKRVCYVKYLQLQLTITESWGSDDKKELYNLWCKCDLLLIDGLCSTQDRHSNNNLKFVSLFEQRQDLNTLCSTSQSKTSLIESYDLYPDSYAMVKV